MATIDDVYNYLTGTVVPKLDFIRDQVAPAFFDVGDQNLWTAANNAGNITKLGAAYNVLAILDKLTGDADHMDIHGFLSTTAPDGWIQMVAGLNATYLYALGIPIADIPDGYVDPESYIAKIFASVFKDWGA